MSTEIARAGRRTWRRACATASGTMTSPRTDLSTTVEADGVTLGVEHFGGAAAPLVLLAGGTTMLSWPDALCAALVRGGRHVVRYDLPRLRRVDHPRSGGSGVHAARPRSRRRGARRRAPRPARGTWRASAWAGWSPRSRRSTTRTRSRRSPSSERGPWPRARLTTTCLSMTRRRWTGCSARPMPDWSDRAAVAEFAASERGDPRQRPRRRAYATRSARGTARLARSLRCRWPTSWAWCSPSSTANRVGAGASPSSRSRRWWCTVAAIRSSPSATAKRSRGDPRCATAGARTGRDGDPRRGRR